MAQIQAVTDTTHLTLARAFPSDADTASSLTYSVLPATRTMVLHYPHAQIQAVTDTTHLTLARAFPSDADTASSLTYSVLPATRTMVLHYPHAGDSGGEGMIIFGPTGCESETAVYLNPIAGGLANSFSAGHDIPGLTGRHFSGEQYSIT